MSWLSDSSASELVPGGWLSSAYSGHGIVGGAVPSTGTHGASILFNDISLPSEAADEFRALILTSPSGLTAFEIGEDGSIYAAGPDGTYNGTYQGFKNGVSYGSTTYSLTIGAGAVAPVITVQASAASVTQPGAANFGTIAISGTYTSIQWQRQVAGAGAFASVSGGSGATTTSYTSGATTVSGGGHNNGDYYRPCIEWSGGFVYGTAVLLSVAAAPVAPTITVHPVSVTVATGGLATFSVTATGTGPLAYQARRNGVNITGATSSTYSFVVGSGDNGAVFSFVVNNGIAPNAISDNATLTVTTAARTVTLRFFNDATAQREPLPSLTGLKWAFFDTVSPSVFGAPVNSGAIEATDSSGNIVLQLPNTTLTAGQTGWLVVTNSDGTTTQNPPPRSFSAPVLVA